MKKIIVIVVFSVLIFASVTAEIGVKFGGGLGTVNNPTINDDGYYIKASDQYVKNAFHMIGGFYYSMPINDTFSFQMELLYANRGFKVEYDRESFDSAGDLSDRDVYEVDMNVGYIEMPLLVKAQLNDTFSLFMGPSAALSISSSYSMMGADYNYDPDEYRVYYNASSEFPDSLQSLVVNFHMGIEYKLTEHINIELRYVMGLTHMEKMYEFTDADMAGIDSDAEYYAWLAAHPFSYGPDDQEAEDFASIESRDLYLIVGYRY